MPEALSLLIGLAMAVVGLALLLGMPVKLGGMAVQGKHARVVGVILIAPLLLPFAIAMALNSVAMGTGNDSLIEETSDFIAWLSVGLPVICLLASILYTIENLPRRKPRPRTPEGPEVQAGGLSDALRYRAMNADLAEQEKASRWKPEPEPEPVEEPALPHSTRRPDHYEAAG